MDAGLHSLPTELLVAIFKHFNFKKCLQLRLTCRRFNEVIVMHLLPLFMKTDMPVTNQLADEMRARSKLQLNIIEKTMISKNWINGRCYPQYINKNRTISSSLYLEKHYVWVGFKKSVKCFNRRNDYHMGNCIRSLTTNNNKQREVYKFVYKDNCVISGLVDGSLWIWCPEYEELVLDYKECHSMAITAVDLYGGIFATGSKDNLCTLWQLDLENPPAELISLYNHAMGDEVLCTRFSPSGEQLFVGTAGRKSSAFSIFDVESNRQLLCMDSIKSAPGILDIKWASPDILWTCESDGLTLWDLRENQVNKRTLSSNHLQDAICFDYDNYCTAIVGHKGGEIVVWDTRKVTAMPVQTLLRLKNSDNSDNISSLAFDATHLYVATKCNYMGFDFRFPTSESPKDLQQSLLKITFKDGQFSVTLEVDANLSDMAHRWLMSILLLYWYLSYTIGPNYFDN